MAMDPPTSGPAGRPTPYPVPERSQPESAPVEEPRPSPVDLLPPAEESVRRARRREREQRERASRRRSWPQRIVLGVLVIGILGAATGASVAAYGLYKLDSIPRVEVALSQAPPGEPENYLIVGSDTRDTLDDSGLDEAGFTGEGAEGSGQRADTIMVARLVPATQEVHLLSLPRDLWLPIAGTGRSQRINTAYAGGPQQLVDTIETHFDIPIHHYVEVDFAGFAGLVDAIGGVPMWFDTAMRDTHSGLQISEAGCHVLDPQMALAFARSRHLEYRDEDGDWSVDGSADLGRITRQQVFLRRAADQVSGLGVGDAVTLNRLADVGIANVTLDRGLGLDDLLDLGQRFGDADGDALITYALPVYPYRTSGGASVLGVEEAEAQPTLNVFRGRPLDALAPVQVDDVIVLNGTGETGQAGLVADALEEIGFGISEVGDVEPDVGGAGAAPVTRTRIRYAAGAERAADLLERHLTAGATLEVDPTLDDGELVLETGRDLTTIGRRARPLSESTIDLSTTTTTPGATSTTGEEDTASSSTTSSSTTTSSTTTSTAPVGVAPDAEATCT